MKRKIIVHAAHHGPIFFFILLNHSGRLRPLSIEHTSLSSAAAAGGISVPPPPESPLDVPSCHPGFVDFFAAASLVRGRRGLLPVLRRPGRLFSSAPVPLLWRRSLSEDRDVRILCPERLSALEHAGRPLLPLRPSAEQRLRARGGAEAAASDAPCSALLARGAAAPPHRRRPLAGTAALCFCRGRRRRLAPWPVPPPLRPGTAHARDPSAAPPPQML